MPKKSAKKNQQKLEREIREAVENIPSILAEHIKEPNRYKTLASPCAAPVSLLENKKKHYIMWAGVSAITMIILSMWYWNAMAIFQNMNPKTSIEAALIENAAKNMISAVSASGENTDQTDAARIAAEQATQREEQMQTEAKIRAALAERLASASTSMTFTENN